MVTIFINVDEEYVLLVAAGGVGCRRRGERVQGCKLAGRLEDARSWLQQAREYAAVAEGADASNVQRYDRMLQEGSGC